jgi:hypothetical protein
MFFIVPTIPKATTPPPRKRKLSSTDEIDSSGYYRRRVPTAYALISLRLVVAYANDYGPDVIVAD